MTRPTALIAEDEPLLAEALRTDLARLWPELQVVAVAGDGQQALDQALALRPTLCFLDIRMPGMSGLDVARAASGRCHIVFTTAYDSHAVAAFEAGAVDYLLKPVAADRLAQTVQRLQAQLASAQQAPALEPLVERLAAQLQQKGAPEQKLRWLSASVGDTIKLFGIDEVLFFQSDEKYTRVVTAQDEAHIRKPLKEIADGLDAEEFWQVHRGVLVRASAIARAQRDEMGRITLHLRGHPEKLAVSQAWAWRFKPM
jgi:DNA-binding LytR/AlgR family response regulator